MPTGRLNMRRIRDVLRLKFGQGAHSILGCEISPILLESKENERWRIQSLICVNGAR